MKNIKSGLLALAMTTAFVAAPASAATLTTTFADNNSQNGNIFDVLTGANAITLTSLGLNVSASAGSTADFAFFYRLGTAVGFEDSSAGWTQFSTNTATASQRGSATLVDIADLTLAANTRYGLYFTRTDGGSLAYTNGTGIGNVAASNTDLTVFEGYGKSYPFGSSFAPRTVNATFNYTTAAVPEPATWALMILGMGAVGFAMRRSRKSKVATTVRFA